MPVKFLPSLSYCQSFVLRYKWYLLILLLILLWPGEKREAPIEPDREFRAAWVATVVNINWPSKPALDMAQQQQEAITLLDRLQALHFNAVILQVRPQADALYRSELEPWSYYLTGKLGWAPEDYYDPLQFWIEAAHQRGLELHAWINPYRVHHPSSGEIGEHSLAHQFPEAVVKLEKGFYWFDPSHPESEKHTLRVVEDMVSRYDIDGIHMDDYFYPYPSYNNDKEFPDGQRYQAYLDDGGELSRADWRRGHINRFIEQLYQTVKSVKESVKIGISPFGIWRPDDSRDIRGLDQFDTLYADARLWLNQGWIDYFAPQLYWRIAQQGQSYPMLLHWWEQQNILGRHLWPGIKAHDAKTPRKVDEVENQIMINRALLEDNPGQLFWHIGGLLDNPELSDRLLKGAFREQALTPVSPWMDMSRPDTPDIDIDIDKGKVRIDIDGDDDAFNYVLYRRYDNHWQYQLYPGNTQTIDIALPESTDNQPVLKEIGITSVNKLGIQSYFTYEEID